MADQPTTPTPAQAQQQVVAAALRGGVPLIYANGFAIANTASDMSIILIANGNPAASVSMSYTSAKSLLFDLQNAINMFEQATGQNIKTINELTPGLEKAMKARNAASK